MPQLAAAVFISARAVEMRRIWCKLAPRISTRGSLNRRRPRPPKRFRAASRFYPFTKPLKEEFSHEHSSDAGDLAESSPHQRPGPGLRGQVHARPPQALGLQGQV